MRKKAQFLNTALHTNVHRTSETEILDVAPIDLLNGMSNRFIHDLPLPDVIKAQALDVSFHWVSEEGETATLTGGLTIQCTVS